MQCEEQDFANFKDCRANQDETTSASVNISFVLLCGFWNFSVFCFFLEPNVVELAAVDAP